MGAEHLYLGKMIGDKFHTNWCIENNKENELCGCNRYGLDTEDVERERKKYREDMMSFMMMEAVHKNEMDQINSKMNIPYKFMGFIIVSILLIWSLIHLLTIH